MAPQLGSFGRVKLCNPQPGTLPVLRYRVRVGDDAPREFVAGLELAREVDNEALFASARHCRNAVANALGISLRSVQIEFS